MKAEGARNSKQTLDLYKSLSYSIVISANLKEYKNKNNYILKIEHKIFNK